LPFATLEKRPDSADRFAAVIERRVDAWRRPLDVLGRVLHASSRGNEERDASTLFHELTQKAFIEKLQRSLVHDAHLRRFFRIEVVDLEYVARIEILRVEIRIDGGRQPDEARADALAQSE